MKNEAQRATENTKSSKIEIFFVFSVAPLSAQKVRICASELARQLQFS